MCVSTVGRVVAIDGDHAIVDLGEVTRRAQTLLLPDVAVGDEVLLGLGAILGRVDGADRRRLDLLRSGKPTRSVRRVATVTATAPLTSVDAYQGEPR